MLPRVYARPKFALIGLLKVYSPSMYGLIALYLWFEKDVSPSSAHVSLMLVTVGVWMAAPILNPIPGVTMMPNLPYTPTPSAL